jgi:hypothetical protein
MVSAFSTIHEEERPIADQLFIKGFFSAKRKSNVKIPTAQQLFIWDLTILLQHVKDQPPPKKKKKKKKKTFFTTITAKNYAITFHGNHVASKFRYWPTTIP